MKSQRLLFVTAWLIWIIFLSACAPSQSAAPTLTPSPTAFPTPDLKPASTFVVGESKIPEDRFLFVEYGEAEHVADVPGNKCAPPSVNFDGPLTYWFEDERLGIYLDDVTRVTEIDACWIASCATVDGKLVVDHKSVSTRTLGFTGCWFSTSVFASGGSSELWPVRGLPFVPCSSDMRVLNVDEQGTIVVEIMGSAYLMEPNQSWTYSVEEQVAPECWQVTNYTFGNFGLRDKDKVEIICYDCPPAPRLPATPRPPTSTPSAEQGALPVGKSPSALAFDGKWLWIANYGDNTVQAIDPDTREVVVQPIKVGAGPADLAFDGQRMWVLNREMNTVQSIDVATGIARQPVKVGRSPSRLVYDGHRLWVTNVADGTVQAINSETGVTSKPVRVGVGPWALAVDQPGKRLWVANILSDTVQAIDVESGETQPPIRVGSRPTALAFDGARLWVLNFGDSTVQSIDPATLQVSPPIPVGKEPYALIFDGARLWVANRWDHTVQAIDPNTNETHSPIAVSDAPWALATDGKRLWVAISDRNAVQYIRIEE